MTSHHERIDLEAPLSGDFQAVVRLIIGGIAERVDFAFEEIDDLQLAVERLLAEAGPGRQRAAVASRSARAASARAWARCRERAVADALRDGDAAPGQLTLRRILQTVVDSFGVEEADGRRRSSCGSRSSRASRERATAPLLAASEKAREEDRELLRRYHEDGDTTAREELIERHLPLVRSLARRYAGRGEALEDIEQVGAIGLIKAIDRFELEREVSLATYATPERGRRDQAPLPRQGLGDPRAARAPGAERVDVGRDRAAHRQARALAEHRRDRRGAEDHAGGGARGDGGRLRLLDRLALHRPRRRRGARPARDDRRRGRGVRALRGPRGARARRSTGCPQREREILRMRFEEGLPQTQIAQRVGLSQMHVSRLIRKSLTIMREELLRMPSGRRLTVR